MRHSKHDAKLNDILLHSELTRELDPSQIFEQFAAVDGHHVLAEAPAALANCLMHISK
jgi:hypothetical protein